jgi:hypothetical protein
LKFFSINLGLYNRPTLGILAVTIKNGGHPMAEQNEQAKQWAKIVAKAWEDEDYKQRLMADPASVLAEEGISVPDGVEIKLVEATDTQAWMVLPPKPEDGKIEEARERLAAFACAGPYCGNIPLCGFCV